MYPSFHRQNQLSVLSVFRSVFLFGSLLLNPKFLSGYRTTVRTNMKMKIAKALCICCIAWKRSLHFLIFIRLLLPISKCTILIFWDIFMCVLKFEDVKWKISNRNGAHEILMPIDRGRENVSLMYNNQ